MACSTSLTSFGQKLPLPFSIASPFRIILRTSKVLKLVSIVRPLKLESNYNTCKMWKSGEKPPRALPNLLWAMLLHCMIQMLLFLSSNFNVVLYNAIHPINSEGDTITSALDFRSLVTAALKYPKMHTPFRKRNEKREKRLFLLSLFTF
ncbi:hypothetical protein VNO80_09332 [Phaseolus coccineus]|uniref:Uncharacterized protein n=1 Tax=Phaseolus coccineus TaxID=3886 RepID=A0AAN9RIA2_PHACN